MLSVNSCSLALGLPSRNNDSIEIANLPYRLESIKEAIATLTPPNETVYLHGSNSASLKTFSDPHQEHTRGHLLSKADLLSEGISVESGESTSEIFTEAYDSPHTNVSAYHYRHGNENFVINKVSDYCTYNCSDERYPVLYVISEKADFEDVGYGESQIPRISPEHILGILAPAFNLPDVRSILSGRGIASGAL